MPILVIAVVAFIIFLTLMALVISAVITEQRTNNNVKVLSDSAALDAAPPKQNATFKPA